MTTRRSSLSLLLVAGAFVAIVVAAFVIARAVSDQEPSDSSEPPAQERPEPETSTGGDSATIGARKHGTIERVAQNPWPNPDSTDPWTAAIGQIAHAYASYLAGDAATGDRRVDELYESEFPHPGGPAARWPGRLTTPVFMRMYVIDELARSRMGDVQEARARQMVGKYIGVACPSEEASGDPWSGDGSDAARKTNCLLATYAVSHPDYAAWREHLKGWLQERAKNGLHDEIHSPVYEKYVVASLYNLADFPGDEDIRRLAKQYLDLVWHDAAHDYNNQTQVQGASGSRAYQADPSDEENLFDDPLDNPWTRPWLYMYDWHDEAPGEVPVHPVVLNAATSSYAPLSISRELATMEGKDFEYASRRPGRAGAESGESHHIRRDVTVNDDYMLGATTYDPEIDRAASGSENVWYTVSINHEDTDRIVISGLGDPKLSSGNFADYYAINGAAHEDVIIAARDHEAENSRGMRVYLGRGDLRSNLERDSSGWLFTQAGNAYAAIRIPEPSLDLPTDENGQVASIWLDEGEDFWAPIVVQMGQASNFDGYEDFKSEVKNLPYDYRNGTVTFTSLNGNSYEMSRQQEQAALPLINGREPETDPLFSYESPYLSMEWKSLSATLTGPDGESVTLDFRY